MNGAFRELAERIRNELEDLKRCVDRVTSAWSKLPLDSEEDSVYLDSVALNLHSFYSGLERLFELIARRIDGRIRSGESWHRELLTQMSIAIDGIRPAVIGLKTVVCLDELRRFRHLVRNVYGMHLTARRMESLMRSLSETWSQVQAEFFAFADFLDALDQARNDSRGNGEGL